MSDWHRTTWGEVIQLQRGFDITKDSQVLSGEVPVVSSGGVGSFHDKAMSDGPGVAIGRKGTLGRVHYLPGPFWPHDTTLWVRDFKGNNPRFVYYALKSMDTAAMNVGSASPTLNRNDFHPLAVTWPSARSEQERVVEVLGALDDKIAANAMLVAAADEVAGLMCQAMTDVVSESRPLSSLAQFVNGKAFTKDATGTGRVVIRIAELNSGPGASTVYNDLDVAEQYLARPGDLLFAWSGSLTVQRWFRDEGIVNQHIFKVIPTDAPLWVVNGALRAKLAEFKGIAADKATTMGHIQRHHLDEPVLVPDDEGIAGADAVMQALWKRALQAERESLKLAELRDTLLPELMSGRLRVKDAERIVEGEV